MDYILNMISWSELFKFLNSSFTLGLIGTGLGAWAGATAAQNIAERNKLRAEFLTQIRDVNTAITLTFMICNSAISLKTHHTKKILDAYFKSRDELFVHEAKVKSKEIPPDTVFEFQADLLSITLPEVPIRALQEIVYGSLSVPQRALALVSSLATTISTINNVFNARNSLMSDFKKYSSEQRLEFPNRYFAKPLSDGQIYSEYLDTMLGIRALNDDLIFFSRLLQQDLNIYGNSVLSKFQSSFKDVTEVINDVQLRKDIPEGVIPSYKDYPDWIK